MLSTAEIFFLLFFTALLILAIYLFYRTYSYGKSLKAKPLVRGMNGSQGDTIQLECPAGQVIQVNQANYICTGGENGENNTCDPILTSGSTVNAANYGTFNPATTQNVAATIGTQVNGKQSATITVPTSIPNICNGGPCTNTIQLIGTYYCVAAKQ